MSAVKKTKTPNPMTQPCIEKITVNIGVGEAGDRLQKAESVLQSITNHKPVQTLSNVTSKDLGLRKQMPIGCKVTLRGEAAHTFLAQAFETRENKIAEYAFDDQGNFSFGIPDHTLFKNQKYNPDIGIFGMDVCITMKKPGYRIKKRRIQRRKIHSNHIITREESMQYISSTFKAEVVQ